MIGREIWRVRRRGRKRGWNEGGREGGMGEILISDMIERKLREEKIETLKEH